MKTIKRIVTGTFATMMACGVAYTPVLATTHTDENGTTTTTVENKKAGKEVTTITASNGIWMENSKGWWYRCSDGSYLRAVAPEDAAYAEINGKKYAFNAEGYMIAGWFEVGDKWAFADSNGVVLEDGWLKWGDNWYFFIDGEMATSQFVDNGNYYVGKDGKMVTGWQKFDDDWYYFRPSNGSAVKACWLKHGDAWYYLDYQGKMVTNSTVNGYHLDKDGKWTGDQDGWKKNSTGWWYSKDGGYLKDEWLNAGDTWYFFDDKGYMVTGWKQIGEDKNWYFFNSDGAMQTSWVKFGGSWYHFTSDGIMETDTTVDGYKIGTDGKMTK